MEQSEYLKADSSNKIYENDLTETNQETTNDISKNKKQIFSDEDLLKNLFIKTCTKQQMIKQLLTYDLINSSVDKMISPTLESLMDKIKQDMEIYFRIVGGFSLEDDWVDCKNTKRFILKDNQRAIFNTTELVNMYDKDLILFLKRFVNHIKKYTDKFSVKYKTILDHDNEIAWVLIIIEKNNLLD